MNVHNNGYVTLHNSSGVTTVSFFHPSQNCLPGALLAELTRKIEQASNDQSTKVIILKSEGERTFCAGASFDELMQIQDKEQGKAFFSGFANVINACRKSPKMVIARVQGRAVGGGVGLAAVADYCFAMSNAFIKLSELTIGIGPFVIAPAVIRKIGLSAFTELTFKANDFQSANWAQRQGLYNDVFDHVDEMDDAIIELAGKLASYHPEALMQLKAMLWEGTAHWDSLLTERAAVSGELVLSTFTRQALDRFAAKRA